MLLYNSRLSNVPILSVQAGGAIGRIIETIIDPDSLKVIAFRLAGPEINRNQNLLDIQSIRESSTLGIVIDSIEELVSSQDVIKISEVLGLNFNLVGLKVETKKGSKLGKIIDYTINDENYLVQQIIVSRPKLKALIDPELTISRNEIIEVTDYKVIIKDEEKVLKKRAENEDFIPNFVNPFRDPNFAGIENKKNDQ